MSDKCKPSWVWREEAPKWPLRMRNGSPWPRVTVVTPSFNQGKYLEETIRSVLQQGYPNLEYIIIDGGSTDNSVEIIRKYEKKLTYWVSEQDRGQTHALNKGLGRATGEIIGWLNSDDMYTRKCFRKMIGAFTNSSDAAVVHGNRILMDMESRVIGWAALPPFDPDTTGYIICSETAFWRRVAQAGISFKEDLRFAMDLEFFSRQYRAGRFVKLNAFLGYFRCHRENKSSTLQDICMQESEQEWKRIFGVSDEGWRNKPKVSTTASVLSFIRNPRQIAYPYLYRRLMLRKRGI